MDKSVEEIIEQFDFEKVRKAMVALNWCWYGDTNPPSIGELVLSAQKLLNEVLEEDLCALSTGGFLAENRNGLLSLLFVLEEWDVDMEEI